MTTKAVTGACVLSQFSRSYATKGGMKHYKVLVAGGGTGGLAVGARARRSLGPGQVAVVEPSKVVNTEENALCIWGPSCIVAIIQAVRMYYYNFKAFKKNYVCVSVNSLLHVYYESHVHAHWLTDL